MKRFKRTGASSIELYINAPISNSSLSVATTKVFPFEQTHTAFKYRFHHHHHIVQGDGVKTLTWPKPRDLMQPPFEASDAFLQLAERKFTHHPRFYEHFVEALRDYERRHINVDALFCRAYHHLYGDADLLRQLAAFLPRGYRVEVFRYGLAAPERPEVSDVYEIPILGEQQQPFNAVGVRTSRRPYVRLRLTLPSGLRMERSFFQYIQMPLRRRATAPPPLRAVLPPPLPLDEDLKDAQAVRAGRAQC